MEKLKEILGKTLFWKVKVWHLTLFFVLGGVAGAMKPNGVKGWKKYFDDAKSDYCSCVEKAQASTRNIEKQEREIRYCHSDLQKVYEELEDDTSLSDEEFKSIDDYIQKEYNKPCK
tara:strand:+ start:138 stop:485 length:348 start_codon:yes stop_codon:yes gene_type:complete